MNVTAQQLEQMQARIKASKKPTNIQINTNLFGEEVEESIMAIYEQIFNIIVADKNYIFIPGQVIGKKNNYEAQSYFTGKSKCCNSTYDKKTKICHACGNPTSSDRKLGKIDLNKKAMAYKLDTASTYMKYSEKFKKMNPGKNFALVGIFIIRNNSHRFDFDNMKTMIGDQLTSSGMIEDDSADKLIMFPLGYKINKTTPGVIIKLFSINDYLEFIIKANGNCKK